MSTDNVRFLWSWCGQRERRIEAGEDAGAPWVRRTIRQGAPIMERRRPRRPTPPAHPASEPPAASRQARPGAPASSPAPAGRCQCQLKMSASCGGGVDSGSAGLRPARTPALHGSSASWVRRSIRQGAPIMERRRPRRPNAAGTPRLRTACRKPPRPAWSAGVLAGQRRAHPASEPPAVSRHARPLGRGIASWGYSGRAAAAWKRFRNSPHAAPAMTRVRASPARSA